MMLFQKMSYSLIRYLSRSSSCFALRIQNERALHTPSLKLSLQNLFPGPNVTNNIRLHSSTASLEAKEEETPESGEMVKFTFVTKEGEHVELEGETGKSVMSILAQSDVSVEGACAENLACTTCHVYVVQDEFLEKFEAAAKHEPSGRNPGEPSPRQQEEDLLDSASCLKPNSRLSCQLILAKEVEGVTFKQPPNTVNMAVDGFKPSKH